MRTPGDPLLLELQRFNAARMLDLGLEVDLIAASLDVHEQTVRHWRRLYEAGGLDALKARIHPGPEPQMGEPAKRAFLKDLAKPPRAFGLPGTLWSTKLMARLLRERFEVDFHPSHVGQMMHELDHSPQMPATRPMERDDARLERWRTEHWPTVVRRARETGATLVFADEAGFLMDPLRKKVWAPRGQTPVVTHRARHHEKVSVIGGLHAGPGPQDVGLLTLWRPGGNIDQHGVIEFLEGLVEEIAGPVIVVWDNLSTHRSKLLKAWLKTHPNVWLEALPPYAPELNPIEMVWCMTKYHRMANHTAKDIEELHAAARKGVDEVALEKQILLNCIRHTGLANALYPDGGQ